jgi:hypothetical protein
MNRIESEIMAVRELPPGLPDPADESVSRVWHSIVRRQVPSKASRRRPLLVPVMAAAVVLGLAVGGAVLVRPAADHRMAAPGAAPPSVQAVLTDMIDKAGRIPAAEPGPDDLVYSQTTVVSTANGAEKSTTCEGWAAPEQMMPLRATCNGVDSEPDVDSLGVDNRNIVQAQGGSFYFPTVQWIAAAPTEREALLRYLQGSEHLTPSSEVESVGLMAQVFERGEPLVTPRLRVALYEILADLHDLTVEKLTLAGRTVWAVTHGPAHTYGSGLLFDAETGRTLGRRSKWIGSPPANRPEIEKRKLPDDYSVLRTWLHAIVGSVHERP